MPSHYLDFPLKAFMLSHYPVYYFLSLPISFFLQDMFVISSYREARCWSFNVQTKLKCSHYHTTELKKYFTHLAVTKVSMLLLINGYFPTNLFMHLLMEKRTRPLKYYGAQSVKYYYCSSQSPFNSFWLPYFVIGTDDCDEPAISQF